MDGWTKLHRKIMKWEWYTYPNTFHLFSHLIMSANHKDTKWRGVEVKRGQLITGRKLLHKETKIPEQSIRTCLAKLKSTGELTIQSTNRFSIITICNYEEYQHKDGDSNQPTNQQSTSNQPATNQQLTTSKKVKKVKKVKKTTYGEFENVFLADNEYLKLSEKFNGTLETRIERLSEYMESQGRSYKSHYATILAWARKDEAKEKEDNGDQFDGAI